MTQLNRCSQCDAFLPARASACPVCQAAVPRVSSSTTNGVPKLVRAALALGASSTMAITLMACYGAPMVECTDDMDRDGDGYHNMYECYGETASDCDDDNADVHVDAEDLTVDDIDQNCDGIDGIPQDDDAGTSDAGVDDAGISEQPADAGM